MYTIEFDGADNINVQISSRCVQQIFKDEKYGDNKF